MESKGKRIYSARKNAGLTLEELGAKVGVSKATIKRYESDEITNIPSDRIMDIANATGVTAAYIMGWETLKKEDAHFHASILKDKELLDMIEKFLSLSKENQQLIRTMVDSLTNKKN